MTRLTRDEFRDLGSLLRPAGRQAAGQVLIPGPKCCLEYLRAGGRPEWVLMDAERAEELLEPLRGEGAGLSTAELRHLRPHELARLADQPSPEGILLAGPPPAGRSAHSPHILLDGVQDPGNVGAMLRTALWFGFDRVWLLAPCADPWSPRGIRASMGAVFQLAACRMLENDHALDALASARLVGLDAHAGTPLGQFDFRPDDVLVLGSESHGLRLPAARLDARLRIPGAGRAESLNVGHALAVCAWERFRHAAH